MILEGLVIPKEIFFSHLSPNEKIMCSIIHLSNLKKKRINMVMLSFLLGITPDSTNNLICKLTKEGIISKEVEELYVDIKKIDSNELDSLIRLPEYAEESCIDRINDMLYKPVKNVCKTVVEPEQDSLLPDEESEDKYTKERFLELVKTKIDARYFLECIEKNIASWHEGITINNKGNFEDYLKVLEWWLKYFPDSYTKELEKMYVGVDILECRREYYRWIKIYKKRRQQLNKTLHVFLGKAYKNKVYNSKGKITNEVHIKVNNNSIEEQRKMLGLE